MELRDAVEKRANEIAEFRFGVNSIHELSDALRIDCLTLAEDELMPDGWPDPRAD